MSTDERSNRKRILRYLEVHSAATRAEIEHALRMPYGPTVTRLANLERFGHIRYDHQTDTYRLTQGAALRRKNKRTKITGAAGSSPVPAAPVSIEDQRERIILDMEGPAGLALHLTRDEPDLWEALSAALDSGMSAPALIDLPRRKRIGAVEDALAAWQAKTGGPCGCCGTIVAQPGYAARSYADPEDEPGFVVRGDRTMCDWCADYLQANDGNMLLLRERVGNAIAGTFGVTAGGAGTLRFASPRIIPLAEEVGVYGTRPWSHITSSPALVGAIRRLAELRVHPSRRVRTVAQRDSVAVPGIDTPIHTAATRQASQPPTILRDGTSYREQDRALVRRHMDERAAFLDKHPRPAVDDIVGSPDIFDLDWQSPWSAADQWTQLLDRQHQETIALAKQHPFLDGRKRSFSGVPGRPPATIAR
jgi:hypothetical protein